MSHFIAAPGHTPSGPDGQGWNRLSLNAGPISSGQCALRPRSYEKLWESLNRPPHFGGYAPCASRDRDCRACPVANTEPRRLATFTADVLVRLRGDERLPECHLMNKPEDGWASRSYVWTWQELCMLIARGGWRLGDRMRDEHSEGFWLHATLPSRGGCYGWEPRAEAHPAA